MVTILNRLRRLVVNMMAIILSPTMIHIRSILLVITRLMNGIIAWIRINVTTCVKIVEAPIEKGRPTFK